MGVVRCESDTKLHLCTLQITSGVEKGVELHQFLAAKGVEGIVNGMDVEEWDPAAGEDGVKCCLIVRMVRCHASSYATNIGSL